MVVEAFYILLSIRMKYFWFIALVFGVTIIFNGCANLRKNPENCHLKWDLKKSCIQTRRIADRLNKLGLTCAPNQVQLDSVKSFSLTKIDGRTYGFGYIEFEEDSLLTTNLNNAGFVLKRRVMDYQYAMLPLDRLLWLDSFDQVKKYCIERPGSLKGF